jgi:hypothetical protein
MEPEEFHRLVEQLLLIGSPGPDILFAPFLNDFPSGLLAHLAVHVG